MKFDKFLKARDGVSDGNEEGELDLSTYGGPVKEHRFVTNTDTGEQQLQEVTVTDKWEAKRPDGFIAEFNNAWVSGSDAAIIDPSGCRVTINEFYHVLLNYKETNAAVGKTCSKYVRVYDFKARF